jgi:hypothetical protein
MDWADYLRDQATTYRQLAETAEDLSIKQELLDLAAVCEEVASWISAAVGVKKSGITNRVQPFVIGWQEWARQAAERQPERSGSPDRRSPCDWS